MQKTVCRRLFILMAACAASGAPADDAVESTRAPLQDTFVNYNARTTAYGDSNGIIVGNGREGAMLFDVSGLAGVSAARLRLRVTQCGATEGVVWPVIARVMRTPGWTADTLTWNALPEEFRTAPAAHLAVDDATVAGRVVIPAGSVNTWQEIDVTEAVKSAAAGSGLLSLHLFTTWGGGSADATPLCFASTRHADATLRPVLAFQGAESFPAASSLVLSPTADTFVFSSANGNGNGTNYGTDEYDFLDGTGKRETFMKFDLSGIAVTSVDSAVLVLRMYTSSVQYSEGNNVQYELTPKTDWSESEITWNNASTLTGISLGQSWASTAPDGVVRGPVATGVNASYAIDLAPLVNQALAAGEKTLSLHIWRKPETQQTRHMAFWSKEAPDPANRPRLLVSPSATALVSRTPAQETFVSDASANNKDKSFSDGTYANYVQVGHTGGKVQYATMLFDPTGLENAAFVRFRVKTRIQSLPAGAGVFRATAWVTDAWDESKLTWNTVGPWFPAPAKVEDGVALDGEVASIDLTQTTTYQPYFEADVTAAARAAAQAGRMLTVGVFSNVNWPEFWKGNSSYPAVIYFPDPDAAFGARVTATLDETGAAPALRLSWSPAPGGDAEYTVECRNGAAWTMIAAGLSAATCLDARAEPWTEQTYRITAYLADGTSAAVEKNVTLEPRKTILACADTYVQNGAANAAKSFGTASSMVIKYNGGENTGDVREALIRFDLSDAPARFQSATLSLWTTGVPGNGTGDETVSVLEYPDFEWTDAAAPSWNDVFANTWATPQARNRKNDDTRVAEPVLGTYSVAASGELAAGVPVTFDVTAAIRKAVAEGRDHVTLHVTAYDPNNGWNFGIVTRERAQGVSIAPQITFALKNWVEHGTVITIR